MEKIILDTDIGSDIDDALCLTYLLKKKEAEVLGITSVAGRSDRRAMMADAICRHLEKNIPVYVGAGRPLTKMGRIPDAPQAEALAGWEHAECFPGVHAVEFMRKEIERRPGEITLLAIGPLTNIALLFALYPHTQTLIKRLVLMGGRFYARGAEWNILCDPIAAKAVFDSDAVIYAVGLDVTLQVAMERAEAEAKFDGLNDLRPVSDFIKIWFRHCDSVVFHDPLAAAALFDGDLCSFERGNISIDLNTEGDTLFTRSPDGKHFIASTVDKERFFEEYFKNLE